MPAISQKGSTRRRILAAANRVILRDGPSDFTFEAIVRETGISKGGVLYHFPNKEALVAGMVKAFFENLQQDLSRRSGDDTYTGSLSRAYVGSAFEPEAYLLEVNAGTLAAIATSPELLKPAREWVNAFQAQLERDGLDPVTATLVRLATDGLWYNEMFGLSGVSAEIRNALRQRLLALTRES